MSLMDQYELLELGPVPCDEDCYQTGKDDDGLIRKQAHIWKGQLQRTYPEATFVVKRFPHDFGCYYEVCVVYDPDDDKSCRDAWDIEGNCPKTWDRESIVEMQKLEKENK